MAILIYAKHDGPLDSNKGSFDTHSVKVLVRSHYPYRIAARSNRAQPSSGGF